MSSMSMMIAAAMQEKKRPGSLVSGAKKGAAIAERRRVDEFLRKAGSPKTKKKPTPGQIRTQKAASRRSSITKKVAPAGSGYQNLIDALSTKKKKE